METVKDQDNRLAKDILERRYYSQFRNGFRRLEIYLNGLCKANCEYCYLKRNQKELFPAELYDVKTILNNLEAILKWYVQEHFKCELDIFSAEWLTIPDLADGVIDLLYKYFSDTKYKPMNILAADNMMFIKSEEDTKRVQSYIDRLETIDVHFCLSCSIDGKYCDDGRTVCSDEYYENLKQFMIKNKLRAHPMVSSYNAKHWIDNYVWWINTFPKEISDTLMMLEVRENTWTKEDIDSLIHFLDFEIDYKFKNQFHEDKIDFLRYILKMRTDLPDTDIPYNNIAINQNLIDINGDGVNCSLQDNLTIRVADMSFALCHRLFYNELMIGKFIIKDGIVADFEVNNVGLLIMKEHMKLTCTPICEKCKFVGTCIGFCLGNSYESYGSPLIPGKQQCEMLKAKNMFLIYKYNSMGLFDGLETIKHELRPGFYHYLKELITYILNVEKEVKEDV